MQLRTDGEPRLLVLNRGGMVWASRGYVYDESDEILRQEPLRSARWRARARTGRNSVAAITLSPFRDISHSHNTGTSLRSTVSG